MYDGANLKIFMPTYIYAEVILKKIPPRVDVFPMCY